MKDVMTGLFMAWGNFSRIPCPVKKWDEKSKKWMLALMELVGFMTGLAQLAIYIIIHLLCYNKNIQIPVYITAGILTIIPFYLTGFIHMDGFMDCTDAIMSRRPALEDRRRILKDSRVGAFAVIMAICVFLIYFSGILQILQSAHTCAKMLAISMTPVIARALASNDILRLSTMDTSQYTSLDTKENNKKYQILCIALAITIFAAYSLISQGIFDTVKYIVIGMVAAAVGQFISRRLAVANLKGINGDIAGYSIIWGELIAVIAMAFAN